MLFSSNVFLYFYLPIVLMLYYLSPRKLRNLTLFVVSLIFYGWGEPVYVVLMVATILLNYVFGAWVWKRKAQQKSAKAVLAAGIAANLLILGFFKYAGFVMESLQAVLPFLSAVKVPEITLPIGISFYVFQSMSYIIDVYRDDAPVQKNPITFGTYVTLFPQLIAGPIVRYADVAQQLQSRRENMTKFASGIRMFVVGLAKKVLLANQMGALWQELQAQPGTLGAWVGMAAYALQLYFDFSGYSDMAIGLGRMLGFEFLINFDYPYISKSVTEFWRRWHISLSTWFREYVYIPLGGNRKGIKRQILNLLIVWGLTGLWHGASWNFLLWGLYYGILLILEKVVLLKVLKKTPAVVNHLYTMVIVLLGWSLFYFEDMGALGNFLAKAFSLSATPVTGINHILAYLPLMLVSAIAATPAGVLAYRKIREKSWGQYAAIGVCAVLMLLCVAALVSQSYNPFIYFRF
ncbi:MAG: MBOAT family protein [Oscillospiraceae bacterium]|nr:MBOAT family protein [Oscillospiraceae bacterium]